MRKRYLLILLANMSLTYKTTQANIPSDFFQKHLCFTK